MDYGIIETISFSRFCDSFSDSYKNNFTYEGKRALYDYLNDYANDIGENIELDPIAYCCEYAEYPTAYEAMEQYQPEDMPTLDDSEGMDLIEIQEATEAKALEWLQEHTMVIELEDNKGYIIANF